jgi:hypothetical protein
VGRNLDVPFVQHPIGKLYVIVRFTLRFCTVPGNSQNATEGGIPSRPVRVSLKSLALKRGSEKREARWVR